MPYTRSSKLSSKYRIEDLFLNFMRYYDLSAHPTFACVIKRKLYDILII